MTCDSANPCVPNQVKGNFKIRHSHGHFRHGCSSITCLKCSLRSPTQVFLFIGSVPGNLRRCMPIVFYNFLFALWTLNTVLRSRSQSVFPLASRACYGLSINFAHAQNCR